MHRHARRLFVEPLESRQLLSATTTVLAPLPPGVYGQPEVLVATVTSTGGTPAGTVDFKEGTKELGTGAVTVAADGTATLTLTTLGVGSHTINAYFKPTDATAFDASDTTAAPLTLVVNQATTTTTLVSSGSPSSYGQPLTLTAGVTVDSPGAGNLRGGTVEFSDGTTVLGRARIGSSGNAVFTVSNLSVGTHTLSAHYLGNTNFKESTGQLPQDQAIAVAPTTTTVYSSRNPSALGQKVTFLAVVRGNYGSGTGTDDLDRCIFPGWPGFWNRPAAPTGNVVFTVDGVAQDPVAVNRAGIAIFTTTTLTKGTHQITATYQGDSNYAPSDPSQAVQQTVIQALTSLRLTATPKPANPGQTVTLTATLNIVPTGAGGTSTPTGDIKFYEGDTLLGTAPLSGGTTVSITTTFQNTGRHYITAQYAGDDTFGASKSCAVEFVVSNSVKPVSGLGNLGQILSGITMMPQPKAAARLR